MIKMLVEKAKRLAALNKGYTRWYWDHYKLTADISGVDVKLLGLESKSSNEVMGLIAAAPEMAKLLEHMADELEDARNVLANWCKHECASTLQVYGRHAPNCPYEELGWADD